MLRSSSVPNIGFTEIHLCDDVAIQHARYLLTGSADMKVALWRMSDWSLVHVFRGHKGALLSLVVHPSDAQTFIRIVFRAGMRNPAVHGHVTSLPQCLGILFCMKFH